MKVTWEVKEEGRRGSFTKPLHTTGNSCHQSHNESFRCSKNRCIIIGQINLVKNVKLGYGAQRERFGLTRRSLVLIFLSALCVDLIQRWASCWAGVSTTLYVDRGQKQIDTEYVSGHHPAAIQTDSLSHVASWFMITLMESNISQVNQEAMNHSFPDSSPTFPPCECESAFFWPQRYPTGVVFMDMTSWRHPGGGKSHGQAPKMVDRFLAVPRVSATKLLVFTQKTQNRRFYSQCASLSNRQILTFQNCKWLRTGSTSIKK